MFSTEMVREGINRKDNRDGMVQVTVSISQFCVVEMEMTKDNFIKIEK